MVLEQLICICDGIGIIVLFDGVLVGQLLVDFYTIMVVCNFGRRGKLIRAPWLSPLPCCRRNWKQRPRW